MKQTGLLAAFLIMLTYSCQIEESYHFKKDFSGTSKISVDMVRYLGILPDSTGKRKAFIDSLDLKLTEGLHNFEKLDGISNTRTTWNKDSTVFSFAFDFTGITELNNARRLSNEMSKEQSGEEANTAEKKDERTYGQFIRKKKKVLVYKHFKPEAESASKNNFDDLFKVKLIFSFERSIKSVSHPQAKIFNEENKVVIDEATFKQSITDVIFELK